MGANLEESLCDDLIVGILEEDREDHNGAVTLRLDEHGLLVAVLDVDGVSVLAGLDSVEDLLEGTSKEMALEEAHIAGKVRYDHVSDPQ